MPPEFYIHFVSYYLYHGAQILYICQIKTIIVICIKVRYSFFITLFKNMIFLSLRKAYNTKYQPF